ncbi:MAG TPA: energy-coupling factor transporter transmembrane protein EcfT [Candidatus Pelethenecus faecipullorum]|uniref:Energy-coupling factor transporter transmembrane protein EcfT n=1 Tax=Candidatus Pelethenecus faecipullorum TaxID=2840900 RepID=A0A9D1KIZ2_9MOLU|nr:energy-coupling factor transporter transmembrane protein EcfT [Candidatus Pelethenecus faecipullorum]
MNNIIFGQYVPGNSWLYRLDPRTKVILSVLLIAVLFVIPSFYGILIAFGIFLLIFIASRVSVIRVIRGLKPILFLIGLTFLLQLIYNTQGTLLYAFPMQIGLFQLLLLIGLFFLYFLTKKWIKFKILYFLLLFVLGFLILWLLRFDVLNWADFTFAIYSDGLEKATFIFVRIVIMIGITTLLTISTMSTEINNGLEWLLYPLKWIKVPVSAISMTLALTLRFIPTLLEESTKIMNAQASRGVDFKEGKLKEKITQIISLLIPMFVISFRRAEDLSNAMEARGYVIGAKRTKLDELKFKGLDYFCLIMGLLFLGLAIGSRFFA